MRVAKRISNGRIITGQEGVEDAVILANIATTPIPLNDVQIVEMTKAAFTKAMKGQVDSDMALPEPMTLDERVKKLEEKIGKGN